MFKEPPKNQQKPKKKSKEAPKLPWDCTSEESRELTQAAVTEHFKKELEKKEKPINPNDLKFFLGMCKANKRKFIPKPLTDYERSITKSYEKRKSGSSASDVPQLSAQKKQSIEPLVVVNQEHQGLLEFLKSSKLTTAEITGSIDQLS